MAAEPRKAVFTTARSARHRADALEVAPEGLDVVMLHAPDRVALEQALAGASYLISERSGRIDAGLLDAAPDLQLVLRLGSLSHDIDLEACRARGVVVCQSLQEGVLRAAEFVVLQMLALTRRLGECAAIAETAGDDWVERRTTDENAFAYNWSGRQGLVGLRGRTVGILGLGEIGTELARRLAGWGCELLYGRRTRLPGEIEQRLGISYAANEALLGRADLVVCLLPFTDRTQGWLDDRRLGLMRRGAFLVSAGSGGVIDEAALARRIASGHLAGAALDTFAVEPVEASNPLVGLVRQGANVLLTPHVAGGAPAGAWRELAAMYEPIRCHMAGLEPPGRLA